MIPLFKIYNPGNIGEVVQRVYDGGIITEGEYTDKFEREFGEYIKNPNTCLVNSCTSALTLAAHLCDIKPGDEVITTAMTCMATNEPFYNAGAILKFADVDPYTGNIISDEVCKHLSPKTKAVIMVHWAGQPADIDEITRVVKNYSPHIMIIEDAAHAVRSTYKNNPIGTHSDFVCFSFQAIKHLSTVDGGAIACKSAEHAELIRKIRWFGLDRNFKSKPGFPPASRWEQDITTSGFKMHMNNVNAAIGIEQMMYLDLIVNLHIQNAEYYDAHIDNVHVKKIRRDAWCKSSHWIYSILVDDRDQFRRYMDSLGIATDVVHVRNDKYTVFSKFADGPLPNLTYFNSCLTHIPVGWWLKASERQFIVDSVNKYSPEK